MEVQDSSGFAYSREEANCCLTIADAFPEDAGVYTCEAKNEFGSARCNIRLVITGILYRFVGIGKIEKIALCSLKQWMLCTCRNVFLKIKFVNYRKSGDHHEAKAFRVLKKEAHLFQETDFRAKKEKHIWKSTRYRQRTHKYQRWTWTWFESVSDSSRLSRTSSCVEQKYGFYWIWRKISGVLLLSYLCDWNCTQNLREIGENEFGFLCIFAFKKMKKHTFIDTCPHFRRSICPRDGHREHWGLDFITL